MFSLRYSKVKNRIYIKINDDLSSEAFERYKSEILSLIDDSDLGFTVLADLSDCTLSVLKSSDKFNIIRDYGASKGFKANANVLSPSHYEFYMKLSPVNKNNVFLTSNEAEEYLDTF